MSDDMTEPIHQRRPVMARLAYTAAIIMAALYISGHATARALATEVA